MLLAGFANAWGAWALAGTWGWRHAPRAIVAALMLVPVMGLLGAVGLLWRAARPG